MSSPEIVEIDAARGPMMATLASSGGMACAIACGMMLSTVPYSVTGPVRTPCARMPVKLTPMFMKPMTNVPMIIAWCSPRVSR